MRKNRRLRLIAYNLYCAGGDVKQSINIQRVQNFAARIVAHHQSKGPASSHLSNLQWLPIKHRMIGLNFKIVTLYTHL